MANEIKFVFVGDTADYDKAVNDVIKKANKAKEVDKEANRVRKQAVNLEKLLKEEYHGAAKNAGSLKDITKKLADEEGKRLKIAKQLSDEALTQKQRQGLLVDMAKSQARSSGLRKAGLVGLGKLAATTIVGALAAGSAAAIQGTISAIGEADARRSGALQAGQTIEQFQTAQFAKSIKRDPKEIGEALDSLGVIIDADLNRKLTESGDKFRIVTTIVKNKLIPMFTLVAEKLGEFAIDIGAIIETIAQQGVGKTAKQAGTAAATNPMLFLPGAVLKKIADSKNPGWDAEDNFWDVFARNRAAMQERVNEILGAPETAGKQASAMRIFSDSLSRIGLFKSGADSQRQIQKASLGELKQINRQTRGLKETVRDA
tara:strand:- start:2306 stop:3424 length:1119 start_codon:yes stop_codon:yes gene_type:complete